MFDIQRGIGGGLFLWARPARLARGQPVPGGGRPCCRFGDTPDRPRLSRIAAQPHRAGASRTSALALGRSAAQRLRQVRTEDGAEVFLVGEISWGVGPQDVERAMRRVSLLAHTGTPALPVVAGTWVTSEAANLARTQQVWQLTNGHAIRPE